MNECTLEEDRDCRATLSEAFSRLFNSRPQAIHLNVPISEPLFTFDVEQLQNFDCAVPQIELKSNSDLLELWKTILVQAKCPVLVIGQVDDPKLLPVVNRLKEQHQIVSLCRMLEPMSRSSHSFMAGRARGGNPRCGDSLWRVFCQ